MHKSFLMLIVSLGCAFSISQLVYSGLLNPYTQTIVYINGNPWVDNGNLEFSVDFGLHEAYYSLEAESCTLKIIEYPSNHILLDTSAITYEDIKDKYKLPLYFPNIKKAIISPNEALIIIISNNKRFGIRDSIIDEELLIAKIEDRTIDPICHLSRFDAFRLATRRLPFARSIIDIYVVICFVSIIYNFYFLISHKKESKKIIYFLVGQILLIIVGYVFGIIMYLFSLAP